MPESPLKLVKRFAEFQPKNEIKSIPRKRRGLYVLYRRRRKNGKENFNVVYVGMTTSSIRARVYSHGKKKMYLWTHFSAYEVWENTRDDEIIELEGLFRHFYRKDKRANILNIQKTFKKAKMVRQNNFKLWT